jgi:phosphonate transport system substrate-binding protein
MKLLPVLLGALALAFAAPRAVAEDPTGKPLSLSFGVYQTDKATEMYKRFTPLLETLQDAVGKRLNRSTDIGLTIFKSYDDAIDALVDGKVDFVHFGPASYITAKARRPGIELLAMEHENGEKRFKGVIFVAKDSPIQTLEDLRGKRFAFGDKNSTIGRYLVQATLVDNNIFAKDIAGYPNLTYLERHDQVASAVEHGDFDAGSVKFSTFKKSNEKNTLRQIATFDNVTKPLVAREGLDRAVFAAIQQSLFEFKDAAVLKDFKISGFMATSDDEYKFVREGMKKAEEFEKKITKN